MHAAFFSQVGNVPMLQCYYTHGAENQNFHRRIYWMLKEQFSSIVVVHYLETKGNRRNFNCTKVTKKITQYSNEIEPNLEIRGSLSCGVHPNSYQLPLQTTDATSPGSATKNLEHENAESIAGDALEDWATEFDSQLLHHRLFSSPSQTDTTENIFVSEDHILEELFPDNLDACSEFRSPEKIQECRQHLESDSYYHFRTKDGQRSDGSDIPWDLYESQHRLGSFAKFPPQWSYISSAIQNSENEANHLSEQPMDQNLFSDSTLDLTSVFYEQGIDCDVIFDSLDMQNGPQIQETAENCGWSPMFGEVEDSAEKMVDGFLDCHNPEQEVGLACTELPEFECGQIRIESLCIRFGKLLCLSSVDVPTPDYDPGEANEVSQMSGKISTLLKEDSGDWDQMLIHTLEGKFSSEMVKEKLLQKFFKEKLLAWLLQKAGEGGEGPNVLDQGGQGVLHFAAALGYDWAIEPTIVAGVNINFRDVNGWTALHWAAYSGREHTFACLISFGAAPQALSNPTPIYPSGQTPVDLASAIGHQAIIGYLANSGLSSHISSLSLHQKDGDNLRICWSQKSMANADVEQILLEARHQWLHPREICELLRNSNKFRISLQSPNLPPSGSIFLFDRKAGSVNVSQCYCARGEDNGNFQRRSYWMLLEELSNTVLVHHREVKKHVLLYNSFLKDLPLVTKAFPCLLCAFCKSSLRKFLTSSHGIISRKFVMSMLDLFLLNVTHHFLPLKPKPLEAFLNKMEFRNSFLPKVLVNPRSLGVTYGSMGSSRYNII
ncbi:hypothetical protein Pint_26557 [Pistacia integerrima]|uniref:Uncharacterized protein n=1 Tax=Pistacia integerrima TaxID=434235 RepID=A0ACC0YMT8_9ROSI|nr:hypothetical protein Pint_26557 [Pistacia integerrima]